MSTDRIFFTSEGKGIEFPCPQEPEAVHLWVASGPPGVDPVVRQGTTTQVEDRMHDWSWRDGILRYHGAGISGARGEGWLILQFKTPEGLEVPCDACDANIPVESNYCPYCGTEL